MRQTDRHEILVIGMGNVLMQDEGIGVRAVEELEDRFHIPDGVCVMDGSTTGKELFEPMRQCDCLIVADAVNTRWRRARWCASPTTRSVPSSRPSCPTTSWACRPARCWR